MYTMKPNQGRAFAMSSMLATLRCLPLLHLKPRWRFFNGAPLSPAMLPDSQARIVLFTSAAIPGKCGLIDWLNNTLPFAPVHRIPLAMNLCLATGGRGAAVYIPPIWAG